MSGSTVIAQQAKRIQLLEDELQELQGSVSDLSNQLAATRSEADKNLRTANARQRELEETRENSALEAQVPFFPSFSCMRD